MFTPELFRAKAAEYGELARTANSSDDAREFQRRERSYSVLADNEQWLADHHDHTVHAIDIGGAKQVAPALLGDTGAAVEQ